MKVAINRCYGGFSASDALFEALIAKGWTVTKFNSFGQYADPTARIVDGAELYHGFSRYSFVGDSDDTSLRTDPDLIEAIETLGEAASGRCGNLQVVEIPDGVEFTIEEYDGYEHVAEVHRTWR